MEAGKWRQECHGWDRPKKTAKLFSIPLKYNSREWIYLFQKIWVLTDLVQLIVSCKIKTSSLSSDLNNYTETLFRCFKRSLRQKRRDRPLQQKRCKDIPQCTSLSSKHGVACCKTQSLRILLRQKQLWKRNNVRIA